MMRLPMFGYHAPRTLAEAAQVLAAEGPGAMLLGGGTDVLPNMKRRHQTPHTLVALRRIDELRGRRFANDGLEIGAGSTLASLVSDLELRSRYPALWQAASQVATPHIQNMATLGGNLCLDTRCGYYNQNHEWRQSINFCMKRGPEEEPTPVAKPVVINGGQRSDSLICWVATSSPKCLAVSSSDTAPVLFALGARVRLVSHSGEREIPLSALYRNDGIDYLTRRPDEILASVRLPSSVGWRSAYLKLRRRGCIDFPILGVAVALRLDGDVVVEARIVLGAVASCPVSADEAAATLIGKPLNDEVIDEAARIAARLAHPLDNTDQGGAYRKRVAREFVARALRQSA